MAVPAYKFYRFDITDIGTAGQVAMLGELHLFRDALLTDQIDTAAAIVTASTESGSRVGSNVFDTIVSSYWQSTVSPTTTPQWVLIELPSPEFVFAYELYSYAWAQYAWKDWTLSGSNDGINFTQINSETGVVPTLNSFISYVGIPSVEKRLDLGYDINSVTILNRDVTPSYDLVSPVLVNRLLDQAHDLIGADNTDRVLDVSSDVIGGKYVRFRLINDWGLVSSSSTVEGRFDIAYDLAPDVGLMNSALPVFEFDAYGGAYADLTLPIIEVLIQGKNGGIDSGTIELPSFTIDARAGGKLDLSLPALSTSGISTSGTVGSANLSLPIISVSIQVGNETHGVLNKSIPLLTSDGISTSGTVGSANLSLVFGIVASGFGGSNGSTGIVLPLITVSANGFSSSAGIANIIIPMLRFGTLGRNTDGSGEFSGWAVNLENNATTEYRGWEFNSIANFAGVELASSADGIFKIGGNLDDTYAIDAEAITSQTDFDSSNQKRVREAHIGMRSDGECFLKTITNENIIRTKPITRIYDGLHEQRVKLGRGVKSRYWQFGIGNIDGSYFEIDSVEVSPEVLDRRVR